MFSLFKKVSTTPEVALQELNEGQLTQVAGGYCDSSNDHDADDMMKPKHHHHKHHKHHHHHHHHYTSSTSSYSSYSKW